MSRLQELRENAETTAAYYGHELVWIADDATEAEARCCICGDPAFVSINPQPLGRMTGKTLAAPCGVN